MKTSAIACSLLAGALGLATLAHADDNDWHNRDRRDGHAHGQLDTRDGRANDRRMEYNARGPEFERGHRIPDEFRRKVYVVDYREHHLSPPPRGHQWVQVGADYALIAIATGVIANVILNH